MTDRKKKFKKFSMLSTAKFVVAGHGCVDLTPEITAPNIFALVRPGTLVPTGPAKFSIGGAVPNTGAALARLGNAHVHLRCPTASDAFGDVLRSLLTGLGFTDSTMDLRFDDCADAADRSRQPTELCTSFSIIISPKGQDRFILHCPGVNPRLRASDILTVSLAEHDWLHVGYPPLLDALIRDDGMELRDVFAAARTLGLTTSLDMCTPDTSKKIPWRSIFAQVLPLVHCFTPSLEEICMCLGEPLATNEVASLVALRRIADELLGFGVPIVLIKLSSTGLYLKTSSAGVIDSTGLGRGAEQGLTEAEIRSFRRSWSGQEIFSPSFCVDCIGTLGAGDCTIAAFLTCMSLRRSQVASEHSPSSFLSPSEVMQISNAVGACNVEAEDALTGIRGIEETRQRISAGWARHEVPDPFRGSCELDEWGNVNVTI